MLSSSSFSWSPLLFTTGLRSAFMLNQRVLVVKIQSGSLIRFRRHSAVKRKSKCVFTVNLDTWCVLLLHNTH